MEWFLNIKIFSELKSKYLLWSKVCLLIFLLRLIRSRGECLSMDIDGFSYYIYDLIKNIIKVVKVQGKKISRRVRLIFDLICQQKIQDENFFYFHKAGTVGFVRSVAILLTLHIIAWYLVTELTIIRGIAVCTVSFIMIWSITVTVLSATLVGLVVTKKAPLEVTPWM